MNSSPHRCFSRFLRSSYVGTEKTELERGMKYGDLFHDLFQNNVYAVLLDASLLITFHNLMTMGRVTLCIGIVYVNWISIAFCILTIQFNRCFLLAHRRK